VEEADVFAVYQQGGQSCVQVFFFRSGQNWGNRAYFPRADRSVELDEVLESFIAQFYDDKPVPRCIFLSHDLAERELLAEALSIKAGRKVEIAVPQRGEKAGLVAHALTNAKEALGRKMADASSQAKLLDGVATAFGLAGRPERIEVYDNSHIQGTNAVGAMIVAGPDGFAKNQYRKFNIKSEALTPGDDYAMMREVLKRRFTRLAKELAQGRGDTTGSGDAEDAQAEDGASMAVAAEIVSPLTRLGFADPPSPARGEGYASPGMDSAAPNTLEDVPETNSIGSNDDPSRRPDQPSSPAGEGGAQAPGEGEAQDSPPDFDDDPAVTEWASEEVDAAEPDPVYHPDGLFADADDKKSSWGIPDLVLIDGGAGQLAAAHDVLAELGISGITLVGIAKGPDRNAGREHFFMRGRASFMLEPRDPVLYFVQRLRDEAHRFAIGTHRAKRSKAIAANPLDEIAGIGPRRRSALLKHFGSAKAISRAGVEDLQAVEGISAAMAQTIYDYFQGEKSS
jgi:excinuclease ABC subunit C